MCLRSSSLFEDALFYRSEKLKSKAKFFRNNNKTTKSCQDEPKILAIQREPKKVITLQSAMDGRSDKSCWLHKVSLRKMVVTMMILNSAYGVRYIG